MVLVKMKVTQSPTIAARFILHGEVVAFPTETVYGLGANIFNEEAIKKIFTAKGRPADNPLIAHVSDVSQLEFIAEEVSPIARKLIDKFFPGPLTIILPKSKRVPLIATGGLNTIGIRMPRHAIAQQFLRACGMPIVAPSANISGRPSATTWQSVRDDLDSKIGCILKGDPAHVGIESTVLDITGRFPVILRAGAVTYEQLRAVIPDVKVGSRHTEDTPKSPGQKYRHYSPKAKVIVCNYPQYNIAEADAAFIGIEAPANKESYKHVHVCIDVDAYAKVLFNFFRECDEMGIGLIYCQAVPEAGLGLALMDRIDRAASE